MDFSNSYDRLAPHYRQVANSRTPYISAVDEFVRSQSPKKVFNLLDVGAGDGVRGIRLARDLRASRAVHCDASTQMVELCRRNGANEVILCTAENLPPFSEKFDVVLCLWNVLGHVPNPETRLAALRGMREVMSDHGALFMDVNNRHNANAYGRWTVLARRAIDGLWPNSERGDVEFRWSAGGEVIPAKGHLFTPREVRDLVERAGLQIEEAVFVDYLDGTVSKNKTLGQMLFKIRKREVK